MMTAYTQATPKDITSEGFKGEVNKNVRNKVCELRNETTSGNEISPHPTTYDRPEPTAPSSYPLTLFVPPIANAS